MEAMMSQHVGGYMGHTGCLQLNRVLTANKTFTEKNVYYSKGVGPPTHKLRAQGLWPRSS
jgi:hypothetical protein